MIDKENGRIEGSLRFANPRFPRYPIPVLKSLQRVATRVCEQITVLLNEILLRLDHLRDATIDRYKNVLLLSCPSNVSVDEINLRAPLSQNIRVHGAVVVCRLRANQKRLLDNLQSTSTTTPTSFIKLFMASLLRNSPFFTP